MKLFLRLTVLIMLGLHCMDADAQCPTINAPNTTSKTKFDFTYNNTTTVVDGTNANLKLTVCAGSRFTFTDKSNLTGVSVRYYYGQITNNTFPPTNFFSNRNTASITTSATGGTYTLITIAIDNTNTIKAYTCQTIEVKQVPNPVFTASSCKAQEVTLNIPTNPNNTFETYTLAWGDGKTETVLKSQIPFTKTYTYTNTTNKIISLTGRNSTDPCTGVLNQQIQPNGTIAITPTIFSLTIADDATNEIRYIGSTYSFEFLEKQSDGTFKKIDSAPSSSSGSLASKKLVAKNATSTQYCYKIAVSDACGKSKESVDEICSIPLDVTAYHKKNVLTWKPINNSKFSNYRFIAGGSIKTITNAQRVTYSDSNTRCIDYNYQITAIIGTMTSISNAKTVRGMDTTKPAPIVNAFSTVDKGQVSIQISGIPTGQTLRNYLFYKFDDNKLTSLYKGSGTRYIDLDSKPTTKQECYKVAYENSCGMTSKESDPFCPVFLKQAEMGLEWTEYQKFSQGLNSYYVEKVNESGTLVGTAVKVDKNLTYEPDPTTIDPDVTTKFRVRAEATNRQNSYSNEIEYSQKLLIFIPDAFTPNQDAINDEFLIKGVAIKEYIIRITDRLGRAVYESTDYKAGWDGTYGGEVVDAGVYLYEIRAKDFKGEITRKSGKVLVMR